MSSEVYILSDQIEEIKLKLTDLEYKDMLDTLKKIKDKQDTLIDNNIGFGVEIEDDNYHLVPKIGSDEWYRLSIQEQAKYRGMKLEYYEEWLWDNLTDQDVQWYKSHLNEVPSYFKDHYLIYPEQYEFCSSYCVLQ